MAIVPTVIEINSDSERHYDIFSLLLKERIIMLSGEINDDVATLVVSQLLYLSSIDGKKDISIYINSPGGSVTAGMAIYDTMRFIKPNVSTICLGMAASMGAFLLAAGEKGKRYALPNSEIMIHQPLGGMQGQATDMQIAADHILKVKHRLNTIISQNTNQPYEKVCQDTERDNYMFAEDALAYGLIDKIIEKKQ